MEPERGWTHTRELTIVFAWLRNGRGVIGLLGGAGVWFASAGALTVAMRLNLHASQASALNNLGHADRALHALHGLAIVWTLGFSTLQVLSLAVFSYVLRESYRLRAATSFSMGAGLVMAGDVVGLVSLMFWVGSTLG